MKVVYEEHCVLLLQLVEHFFPQVCFEFTWSFCCGPQFALVQLQNLEGASIEIFNKAMKV